MPLQFFADGEFVAQLDNWRAQQRPIATRAEALRMLVNRGLAAERK